MSELNERQWTVISERGREASSLTYADASGLLRELMSEEVHGLCIITDAAGARLAAAPLPSGDKPRASKKGGGRRKTAELS